MKNRLKTMEARKQLGLLPGYVLLVLWLLFCIATLGWIVLASLSTTREIFSDTLLESGVHFDNYVRVWKTNKMTHYFINSVIYTVVSVVLVILVSAPAAYAIARKVKKSKQFLINVFLIAMSIPSIMMAIPMYSVFAQMKLTGKMIPIIVLYIAMQVPFTVYFLTNFFATLPSAMEDAALIDGCSLGQSFWLVFFPLAQPGIVTVSIFNFLTFWNEYIIGFIFATKSDIKSLSVALQAIVQAMRVSGDWAGLFAAVIIVFLPTFIIFVFMSKKLVMGVTNGAVKG